MKWVVIALIQLLHSSCNSKTELVWDQNIPVIGSQSSPRAADLNSDGVLDIVMGAGKNEFEDSEHGVLALDGKTGEVLWHQSTIDQVYGSATFYDITGDGIVDVFIGGRACQFMALNGQTGDVIWAYRHSAVAVDPILTYAAFNFNNSVLVSDQNSNGFPELLTANGGNQKAEPGSEKDRSPGVLLLFDSKTGNVIAADTMPDGKESYMSPVFITDDNQATTEELIVFGTGGETIGGNLYVVTLEDLLERKLHRARKIASETGHGFISPPSLADITSDGFVDIIAISHSSTVFAVNGKTLEPMWQQKIENTECSNSLAAGYFTNDNIPDFFTFASRGQWPNSTGSLQVMIDGADGSLVRVDTIGCTGFSSPVAYDLNADGFDEVVISINEYDCSLGYAGRSPATVKNKLLILDFTSSTVNTIDQTDGFKNIFSTPWLGDLDGDGSLDLVYCQYYHYADLLSFLGMRIKRVDLPVSIDGPVAWGGYMGSSGNGVFSGDR